MKRLILVSLLFSSALIAGMGYNMPVLGDFDVNKDGVVTQSEFETAQQNRMTEKAQEGKIMRNAGNAPVFEDIDTDSNGKIDAAEFKKHQDMQRSQMRGQGKGQNRGQGQGRNR